MVKKLRYVRIAMGLAGVLLALAPSLGWQYWDNLGGATSCITCHGGYRTTNYRSLVDNQLWLNGSYTSLHDVHRRVMVSSSCDTCHGTGGTSPVDLSNAVGEPPYGTQGCMGCHGRLEDGTGGNSVVGSGAALRQAHYRANRVINTVSTQICLTCHTDSNPANKTVVGENVKPPFYVIGPTTTPCPNMPGDPCNPAPYRENFSLTNPTTPTQGLGLDNDGDDLVDTADPNCAAATPGEVSKAPLQPLLVTAYNRTTGVLTISYGPTCQTTNNNIEIGALNKTALSTYAWSNRICSIGNTGTTTFNPGTGAYFFVVAGNNGTVEGSYGKRTGGTERPESTSNIGCPNIPQSLAAACN